MGSWDWVYPPSLTHTYLHMVYLFIFLVAFTFLLMNFFVWLCHVACKILVSQPGIEPVLPAVEAQSPSHWTVRAVPLVAFKDGMV